MSSEVFHVGSRKGFFTFGKSKGQWRQTESEFLGIQIPMLLPDSRSGSCFAVVDHGHFGSKLHRRKKGGKWEELDPPCYPEKPDDAEEVLDPVRQKPVPWSLEKLWSLEEAGPDREGCLWAGTIPGGLFYSEDHGESWRLNRPLWDNPDRSKWAGGGYDFPGIHSICVDPRNSDRVAVAISCGGVWITEDNGKSWEQSAHGMAYDFIPADQGGAEPDGQDPHRMTFCAGSPDHYWVQHHCGIYRSEEAGKNWQRIENAAPSAFGFAVAVHPQDPNTAWFVPAKKDEFRYPVDAKFVVTRTRDGGKSFEALDKGLPDPPAYDLVYRHALAVDDSGEKLVMGSTTGSLWISENGGESWSVLSRHLPPVFCVRFAIE